MTAKFDNRQLRERILNDRYNRFVFSTAQSCPVYLVGGYLRDLLRGKVSLDRDYVTGGDHESLLERIVDGTGGKLVRIGDYLHRVVLKDNSTLDFTQMVNDISDDLCKRDFTINSIAWSPGTGLIDPHGGSQDLVKGRIRMISRDNIENDPIRILRAYRFAGELGIGIENRTRRTLKNLSFKILEAKSERITLELFKILNLAAPQKILRLMFHDGVLNRIFTLTDEEFRLKIKVISRINRILNASPLKEREMICAQFSQNLLHAGLIPLEVLLEGRQSSVLLMSSKILKRLRDIERGSRILKKGHWSLDSQFEAFGVMQDATVDLILQRNRKRLLPEYERYRAIMKSPLLSASEIVTASNVRGGKRLGKIISLLRQAEFNREINSREDALLALQRIQSNLT